MHRLFRRSRAPLATLVALTIGVGVAVTAGPASAGVAACTKANSVLYPKATGFPYYRLHTSSFACYAGAQRAGWVLYSIHNWRCGDFNCHSFWLRHR